MEQSHSEGQAELGRERARASGLEGELQEAKDTNTKVGYNIAASFLAGGSLVMFGPKAGG